MKLLVIDGAKKNFEIAVDKFRELYDIISWLGGYAGFKQFNGYANEYEYETFIRNKDDRLYKYDKQKETNTIEFNILDDRKVVIEL